LKYSIDQSLFVGDSYFAPPNLLLSEPPESVTNAGRLISGRDFDFKSKSAAISIGYTDLSTRDLPRKADQRGGLSP